MAQSSPYQVDLAPRAQRELRKLKRQPHLLRALLERLQALADEPKPADAKKLKAPRNLWRVVVKRDYRVIYELEDAKLLVLVVKIGDRKDVYRDIEDL